uniref:Uncharacterized protein n=1 Tax=Anguilla anguilla TaxID=7936 RepID=A0A0E9WRR6_ANGAN
MLIVKQYFNKAHLLHSFPQQSSVHYGTANYGHHKEDEEVHCKKK